jgi:hypothetical protein
VAPDGRELAPSTKPQPNSTLVKALARAWRWQRMLDEGVYTCISEIGDAENISKSYVSRILRLALLAPDLVEAILVGQTGQALVLEQLEGPLPVSWEEQWLLLRTRGSCAFAGRKPATLIEHFSGSNTGRLRTPQSMVDQT